jgi:citrate lyase subunit beta/citryl-CoA lyase
MAAPSVPAVPAAPAAFAPGRAPRLLDLCAHPLPPAAPDSAPQSASDALACIPGPDDPRFEEALARVAALRPRVLLAPCLDGRDAQRLSGRLAAAEARAGLADGAIGLVACLNEAAALLRLDSWRAATGRLRALTWDCAALAADLGLPCAREAGALVPPLAQARVMVAWAAAGAGVRALDAPYEGARGDLATLAQEARAARRDGFFGKVARDSEEARVIAEAFAEPA